MATKQRSFNINGLIDTSRTVMDNIEGIASAVGAFATFDIHQGKWAFVLNETTTPVYDFDDSNIIGAITVSGNGLTETYNSVEVRFPHKDLNDQKDYRRVSIPRNQWYPNERPNRLNINVDYINDPVQAEMMALRELKQSRMDKIIEFTTDFNALGLNAGDIIRVTNDYLGFSSKQFRIVQISEEDGEEGLINLRITGLEWSSDIDNYGTISRFIRDRDTGIQIIEQNTEIQGVENESSLKMQLTTGAEAHGLKLYFNSNDASYTLDYRGQSATLPDSSTGSAGQSISTTSEIRAVITWEFNSGEDLDIRARVVSHNELSWTGLRDAGNNSVIGYTGSNSNAYLPDSTYRILSWGGDNTGTGEETCLVDISRMAQYLYALGYTQMDRYFIVECHGNFYTTLADTPTVLRTVIYNGGTPNLSGFTWRVDNYSGRVNIQGLSLYLQSNLGFDSVTQTEPGANPGIGDLMGYFVMDLTTYETYITNDLGDINTNDKINIVVG